MKRPMVILVALTLTVILSACGGGQSASENPPAPPSAPSVTAVPAGNAPQGAEVVGTQEGQTADDKEYGGIVRFTYASDMSYPFGMPYKSAQNFSSGIIVPFAECLVLEDLGGNIFPWLATEWEIDVEKEEIRYKLRDDVYFSDGSKFNAEAVQWNFDMAIAWGAVNPAIGAVVARGEYEVAVIMAGGFTNFVPNLLASHSFALSSKEVYDKFGEDYAGENPVGTGPYIMDKKEPGYRVTFYRNDNYWQPGKPYLDGIEYIALTDMMTQSAALLSKANDAVDVHSGAVNGEMIMMLREEPALQILAYPSGIDALYPSSENPDSPFAIQAVREAASYAIDRQALADARGFGVLNPAQQLIAVGYFGYFDDGVNRYPYDQAKAKELLASAGYPNGFKSNLYVPQTSDRDTYVAVQNMLFEVGIDCELEFPEPGRMTDLRGISGWEGLLVNPFTSLASMPSSYRLQLDPIYQYNISTWRPAVEMEDDYVLCRTTPEFDNAVFQRLSKLMMDNMVIIPTLERSSMYVVRDSVHDGEFSIWAAGTQWRPDNVWRSSN